MRRMIDGVVYDTHSDGMEVICSGNMGGSAYRHRYSDLLLRAESGEYLVERYTGNGETGQELVKVDSRQARRYAEGNASPEIVAKFFPPGSGGTFQLEWVRPLHPIGPDESPHARLMGHVRILGVDFFVNAEEVQDVVFSEPGKQATFTEQATTIPEEDTYAPEIWQFIDGAGCTVEINGRSYLMAITPFQR